MVLDDQTKAELVDLVKTAVNAAVESRPLSEEEVLWVRLAIKADAERAELRKAIIQKSLAGLAWVFIVFVGGLLVSGLKDHIK
jgi:DNA-binding transcriptional regulator YdaS (Cro superfamily)